MTTCKSRYIHVCSLYNSENKTGECLLLDLSLFMQVKPVLVNTHYMYMYLYLDKYIVIGKVEH